MLKSIVDVDERIEIYLNSDVMTTSGAISYSGSYSLREILRAEKEVK